MLLHREYFVPIARLGFTLVAMLVASEGFAQPIGSTPDAHGVRGERTIEVLRAMDTNHNGMIDADEVTPQQKAFLESRLKRYGMDVKLPVSIDKIAAAQQRYYAARDAQAAGATAAAPAAPSGSSSTPAVGNSEDGDRVARYRRYAESLLKQFDKNHNGVLEREEWSQMRGDWKSADLNGDGKLTVDEIAAHLMGYSARRAEPAGAKYYKLSKAELQQELKKLQKEVLEAERQTLAADTALSQAGKAYDSATGDRKFDALLRLLEAEAAVQKPQRRYQELKSDFEAAQKAYVQLLVRQ